MLILAIRRHAQRHRELLRHDRHSEWLREYYFLLAWYAMRGSLFPTYRRRMFMAVYVSGGIAAVQLAALSQRVGKGEQEGGHFQEGGCASFQG